MLGVTEEQQKIIKNILSEYKNNVFYYFGSRVKDEYVKSSDLDILVKGEISDISVEDLKQKFYESSLPFIVNLSFYEKMDKNFYDKIKSDLIQIL